MKKLVSCDRKSLKKVNIFLHPKKAYCKKVSKICTVSLCACFVMIRKAAELIQIFSIDSRTDSWVKVTIWGRDLYQVLRYPDIYQKVIPSSSQLIVIHYNLLLTQSRGGCNFVICLSGYLANIAEFYEQLFRLQDMDQTDDSWHSQSSFIFTATSQRSLGKERETGL